VALRGSWWTENGGPLLGFVAEDRRSVALIPTPNQRYELLDPTTSQQTRVSAAVAATLEPFAYTLHRRFDRRSLVGWDVLMFGLLGCRPDLLTIMLMMVFAGLLSLLSPLLSQVLFDQAIPRQLQSRARTLRGRREPQAVPSAGGCVERTRP
jgi:ATP-binding cassette subfamily C protein